MRFELQAETASANSLLGRAPCILVVIAPLLFGAALCADERTFRLHEIGRPGGDFRHGWHLPDNVVKFAGIPFDAGSLANSNTDVITGLLKTPDSAGTRNPVVGDKACTFGIEPRAMRAY